MKLVNRTIATLAMLVTGTISSFLVALIWAVLAQVLNAPLWGTGPLPIGAIISGFIAGFGYAIGFRKYPYRPSRVIIPCVVAVSVAAYFAGYFFHYSLGTIDGRPLSALMPFGRYFVLAVQSVPRAFSGVGARGALGVFDYLRVGSDIIGFAIGGFFSCYVILRQPFCTSCDRLMKTKTAIGSYARTLSSVKQTYEACHDLLARSDVEGAVQMLSATGVAKAGAVFLLRLSILECTECNLTYYELSVSQINPRKKIKNFSIFDRLSGAV